MPKEIPLGWEGCTRRDLVGVIQMLGAELENIRQFWQHKAKTPEWEEVLSEALIQVHCADLSRQMCNRHRSEEN